MALSRAARLIAGPEVGPAEKSERKRERQLHGAAGALLNRPKWAAGEREGDIGPRLSAQKMDHSVGREIVVSYLRFAGRDSRVWTCSSLLKDALGQFLQNKFRVTSS